MSPKKKMLGEKEGEVIRKPKDCQSKLGRKCFSKTSLQWNRWKKYNRELHHELRKRSWGYRHRDYKNNLQLVPARKLVGFGRRETYITLKHPKYLHTCIVFFNPFQQFNGFFPLNDPLGRFISKERNALLCCCVQKRTCEFDVGVFCSSRPGRSRVDHLKL